MSEDEKFFDKYIEEDTEYDEEEFDEINDKIVELIGLLDVLSTDETKHDILKLLPDSEDKGDKAFRNTVIKLISKKTGSNIKEIRMLYNNSHLTYPIELNYSTRINERTIAYLTPEGCYSITHLANKNAMNYAFKWQSFSITNKYRMQDGDEFQYDFELDGAVFEGFYMNEMKKKLYELNFQGRRGKNDISDLLNQYRDDVDDISDEINAQCGFVGLHVGTENEKWGWILPPNSKIFYAEDTMNSTLSCIEKMMDIIVENDKAKKYFQDLYDLTTVNYKDIIYAWEFASPFMHCLKSETAVMPMLAFGGPGGRGKTATTNLLTTRFFGNNIEMISEKDLFSVSRFLGSLAGSTFPVGIDECENAPTSTVPIMKHHLTSNYPFRRKKYQKLVVDAILLSAIVMNFNKHPLIFKDEAAKQRIIYLEIITEENKIVKDWGRRINKIPIGYIGKYVIEQTRFWNKDSLFDVYDKSDDHKLSTDRGCKIVKILGVGCYIAKKFFDIELDLTGIKDIIENTQIQGLDMIYESIKYQALRGSTLDELGIFRPQDWVRQKTEEIQHKGIWGVLFDTTKTASIFNQCQDLTASKRQQKTDLFKMLKYRWKDVQYKGFKFNGVSGRYIFVPNCNILGSNMSIYEYQNKTPEELKELMDDEDLEKLEIEVKMG